MPSISNTNTIELAEQIALLVDKASKPHSADALNELVENLMSLLDGSPDLFHKANDILTAVLANKLKPVIEVAEEVSELLKTRATLLRSQLIPARA